MAARMRTALHGIEECEAILAASALGAERGGLAIWAAAIDEAARRGGASGWQVERGLLIGVLPDDLPATADAFREHALPLVAPEAEPHLAYQMGRLTHWPRLWCELGPRQARWGRAARDRASRFCGLSLLSLRWAGAALSAAGERLSAWPLGGRWDPTARQACVMAGSPAEATATVFCPVGQWLDALCAGGATEQFLDERLRVSLAECPGAVGGPPRAR